MWKIIKLVLFYNIKEIIAENDPLNHSPSQDQEILQKFRSDQDETGYNDLADSISFEKFLVEAYKLKFRTAKINLVTTRLCDERNLLHMAIGFGHLYYINLFTALGVPLTDYDSLAKTPFHLAIYKSKQMRSMVLQIMQENGISPMQGFNHIETPLKICLDKGDIDNAHKLIKDNRFITDLLGKLDEDYK